MPKVADYKVALIQNMWETKLTNRKINKNNKQTW